MSAEPDPRVARTRHRVLTATLDLLADGGFPALTVEGIADRSGVAKSTIYRHWTGLPTLVLDAFGSINPDPTPFASTGSLRTDLHAFLTELAQAMSNSRWARLMAALVDAAERDEQLSQLARDFVEQRRRRLRDLLQQAGDRGEIPDGTDPDLLAGLIGGNLFYRRLISREPLDERTIAFLTDVVTRLTPVTHGIRPGEDG